MVLLDPDQRRSLVEILEGEVNVGEHVILQATHVGIAVVASSTVTERRFLIKGKTWIEIHADR